ncbi:MAG: TetR/AcrR family transcriptional regulator [bacterium]|nr:TetR/AcrR family transcriptional regulator [bacterium]
MGLREKKEAQTRERVLKIAMEKFCVNSIEGTKMKDIAEEAEIGERTLYRYFATKEELAMELYLANLKILNDDSMFNELIIVKDKRIYKQKMKEFKKEIVNAIRNIRERLLYDLLYNVYAARRHEDPSQNKRHFMQRDLYKEASKNRGENGVLIYESVSMLIAYTQRLIMLEYQKTDQDWDAVINRFETTFDCLNKGFIEQMKFNNNNKK